MAVEAPARTYAIEGRLLELCTCTPPCWFGGVAGGRCNSVLGWRVDRGAIEGVDVSGRTLALSVVIPENVLSGNWRAVVYVDDEASADQEAALVRVFADRLAGLVGEIAEVKRVPIGDVDAIQGDFRFEG